MAETRAVMIVEDDFDTRESLAEVMHEEGYIPYVASNGKEALEQLLFDTEAPMPFVILVDMMMPVMDGRTFIVEARRNEHLASIPMIVFSAHTDLREAARELGVAGCLKKPVRREDLVDAVAGFRAHVEVTSGTA